MADGFVHIPTPRDKIRAIKREIAARRRVRVCDIDAAVQDRQTALARFEVYEALRGLGYSLPQIGDRVGKRHHSSVLHGLRRLTYLRETQPHLFGG